MTWWSVDKLKAAVKRCEADIAADQAKGIDTTGKERSLSTIKRWLEKAAEAEDSKHGSGDLR